MIIAGHSRKDFFLIHGGAGPMDPGRPWVNHATQILHSLATKLQTVSTEDGVGFVTEGLMLLEQQPEFNAGIGSALQEDGIPRLTASIMDGTKQTFSGVISIKDTLHPSLLAKELQDQSSRVLTDPGHINLARKMKLLPHQLVVPKRLDAWINKTKDQMPNHDTVGCILYDHKKGVFSGSSTGGRGFETPGRVSDSGTVAGNYASSFAAVSVTGIGEEIVDDAVAARIETRVRDGMSLSEAGKKTYEEAKSLNRSYGWIAADTKGNWQIAYTSDAMTFVGQNLLGETLADSQL